MNENPLYLSKNRIHPFPAKMAPAIAWGYLHKERKRRLRVLDPMAGSGTAIVVARLLGHQAIGFDTDPLAVLISNAWCSTRADPDKILSLAESVLASAKAKAKTMHPQDAYPDNADEETRAFTRIWFDSVNRKQLTALALAIAETPHEPARNILWCAFSRMIITKNGGVSLAIDVSHSRPHRVYRRAPLRAFACFIRSVKAVLRSLPLNQGDMDGKGPAVKLADARSLPLLDSSIDLIITSPPYLNAIDYLRGHRLSLVWMGYSLTTLRNIRSENIGTERGAGHKVNGSSFSRVLTAMGANELLPGRVRSSLIRYTEDIDRVLAEIRRVLVPDGRAVLVIGDSTIRGTYVRNSSAIELLAKNHGLRTLSKRVRALADHRRYLPPPAHRDSGKQLSNRMRSEVIITFGKTKVSNDHQFSLLS